MSTARFEGRWCPLGSINVATNISQDHQAATFLFEKFQVDAGGGAVPPARVMTIRLPVVDNPNGARVTQDLRGFVQAEDGARVSLVIESGGAATIVDLNAARVPNQKAGGNDFHSRTEVEVKPGWDYYATIVLTAEANRYGARATLQLDSLDVSISPPG